MKNCPFCKAEIEEDARFCLYCMTSLEEKQVITTSNRKKKQWLYLIAAVFVFIILTTALVLLLRNRDTNNNSEKTPSNSQVIEDDASTNPSKDTDSKANTKKDASGNTPKKDGSSNGNTDKDTGSTQPSNPGGSNPGREEQEEETPTPPQESFHSNATYLYRDATYGDDFSVSADLENAVVITGVSKASSTGEYVIPSTLNGKRVVAIMGLAFCDEAISSTVKKVVVPASVKTIWANAFHNCYNLTDIYFRGNAIYVETNAFAQKSKRTGTLTIHCSGSCSDRAYRYYKNSASSYDALYEEWNG